MAKLALLIGVSEYKPGLNPLPAAVKDLEAIREVLLDPEIGGFSETDVTLLKNPDRQIMEESIYTLFSGRHRDDLLLLFFSGHGIKDDSGTLYLATRSTRKSSQGELITPTAVSANFVHSRMSRSRSKRQVVILDSCFSGAFAEGLSAKDDGSIDIRKQLGGEGRAVLTSSSSTQYSFEEDGEELSLYTRFLIEGIKTGEADLDQDDVISVDELHEYACRQVQAVKPEVKPELYAVREGFKIRLLNVPQGDPRQKYQREVARCGERGELTIVSRSILDTWRVKLGLSLEEAKTLEDEILSPYKQAFQQKIRQYESVITKIFVRDEVINDATRQELRNLQKVLELRNEDTVPIEARVFAALKTRQKNLDAYKELLSSEIKQKYPLTDAVRSQLQRNRQNLELSETDAVAIENQVVSEVKIYRQKLLQYEKAFLATTRQAYPISKSNRDELKQYQHTLGLTDVEIAPIEAQITTQVETYQQKIRQYEDALVSATQRRYKPSEAARTQLKQTWQNLGLSEADVRSIESPIFSQIEDFQSKLQRYEQALLAETEQKYPLNNEALRRLQQSQRALKLRDEDVARIQNRIILSIEQRLEKRQQYEQVFSDSIRYEFPVSDASREELKRFQHVLALENWEVEQIELRVIKQNTRDENQNESTAVLQKPESQPSLQRQPQSKVSEKQAKKVRNTASTILSAPSSSNVVSETKTDSSLIPDGPGRSKALWYAGISSIVVIFAFGYSSLGRWRWQQTDSSSPPQSSQETSPVTEVPARPPVDLEVASFYRILSVEGLGIRTETEENSSSVPKFLTLYPTLQLASTADGLTATIPTGGIVQVIKKTFIDDTSWVQVQLCGLPFGDALNLPAGTDVSTEIDKEDESPFNRPEDIESGQPLILEPGQDGWIAESQIAVFSIPIPEIEPSQQGRCEG